MLKALDLVIGATERDAAVASAVEVERNSKRARRTEQRRHIKQMERLGYEFTGFGSDVANSNIQEGEDMARRRSGPRLKWRAERNEFVITWTEQGCTRKRSTGTAKREEAEIIFGEWFQARGRRGGPRDPSQVLVTDVLDFYQTERGAKLPSARVIGCAIEALTDYWAGRFLTDISEQTCEGHDDWRERSENTVRRELNVLATAAGYYLKRGKITRKVHVPLPEKPPSKMRWLTRDEVAQVLRAALRCPKVRQYLPLFLLLATYTGRRKEAILSLRWCQIDRERGHIGFEGSAKRSNKRRGQIRIPDRLLLHLRRAGAGQPEMGFVLNINGARIKEIYRGLTAAAKRAGVEGVTPHVFRHTAASWLMQSGMKTDKAARFLAMSEDTLENVYGHLHPDFHKEAADTIGRRPGGSRMGR